MTTVEFSETEHMDDQCPAPQQLVAGETDGSDDSTVSGVILTEPEMDVRAQVHVAINQVVSEPREVESDEAQRGTERPVIAWPTTDATPASEFNTPYFFTMAFPCLFPYGKGNFTSTVQSHVLHFTSGRSTCCGIKTEGLHGIKYGSLLFTT